MTGKNTPEFGARYGFAYPLAWRVLEALSTLSLYTYLPITTAVRSDLYICAWFAIDLLSLFVLSQSMASWMAIVLSCYRAMDIMTVLASVMVRGFIKHNPRGQGRASANRTVTLLLLNAIELSVLFAVAYATKGSFVFTNEASRRGAATPFEALYFSVITATTLGYGDLAPIDIGTRLIAMTEVLSMFLVVIVVISTVASQRSPIPDLES